MADPLTEYNRIARELAALQTQWYMPGIYQGVLALVVRRDFDLAFEAASS